MSSKIRRPYKLGERTRLTREPPFTPDGLKAILGSALVSPKGVKNYVIPGDREITELCSILNHWHAHFYQAQEDRAFNELIDAAQAAIESLAVAMPKIRDELATQDKKVGGQDPFTTWALRDAQQATEILCRPIPQWKCLQRRTLPDQAKDWRWLAGILPDDIRTAMKPANPDFKGGLSKGGAVARILKKLIPLMTGETPGIETQGVGIQLQKQSAKKRGQ